jgi:hypothetical protein
LIHFGLARIEAGAGIDDGAIQLRCGFVLSVIAGSGFVEVGLGLLSIANANANANARTRIYATSTHEPCRYRSERAESLTILFFFSLFFFFFCLLSAELFAPLPRSACIEGAWAID